MSAGLQLKGKIALIVSLILALGVSLWVDSWEFLYVEPDDPITPPIDALDEADRLIQTASQNFFYHEFDQAIENYKKVLAIKPNNMLAHIALGNVILKRN